MRGIPLWGVKPVALGVMSNHSLSRRLQMMRLWLLARNKKDRTLQADFKLLHFAVKGTSGYAQLFRRAAYVALAAG